MSVVKYNKYNFEIPENVLNYAKEWRKCIEILELAETSLNEIYNGYGDLDTTVDKLRLDLQKMLDMVASKYLDYWVTIEKSDMNLDSFMKEFAEYTNRTLYTQRVCEDIEDKYAEIVMTKEEAEEYRRIRKENRGRWEGGGFGLSGAMKGAATAGALNVVSGIGHSIVNGIGNIASSIAAESAKKGVYRDILTLRNIKEALKKDIVNIFETHMSLLDKKYKNKYHVPSKKDIDESERLYEDIEEDETRNETEIEAIVYRIFNLNPYYGDLYWYLLERYGDEKNELQKLAGIFGCESEIIESKHYYMESVSDDVKFDDLETAKKCMEEFEKAIQFYGIDIKNEKEIYSKIIKQYETLQIEDIVGKIDYNNEESINNAIESINGLDLTECDAEEILNKIDVNARNCDGVVYDTREEVLQVQSKKEYVLKQAKSCVDNNKYEEAINTVKCAKLPDASERVVTAELSDYLIEKNTVVYNNAKEYEKMNENGETLGGQIIGAIIIMIIGWVVSHYWWFYALYIGIGLGIFAIVQAILQNDNKYKKAYDIIKEYRDMGYSIK